VPADWHLLFFVFFLLFFICTQASANAEVSAGKKVSTRLPAGRKNPVAAFAASEVTAGAWPVQPAPAECEKKAERGFSGLP
jgi:hypothetical protein